MHKLGLALRASDVTLVGDPSGTVLRGCTDEELASMGEEAYLGSCAGIGLMGGRQQVRALTFEGFNALGKPFRSTYHAVAILGRNVHVLNNDVAAPEPEQVPYGWPSIAIGLRPSPGVPCTGNRIEGNTIEGHTDAVALATAPPDGPGAVCEGNTVRDNTVRVHALVYPAFVGPALAGQPLYGVPIRLLNLQQAIAAGTVNFPAPPGAPPWPAEFAQAAVRDNVIEGNRITGAIGVAIELIHASGNRVTGNVIEGTEKISPEALERMAATPPFGIGPGFWLRQPDASTANGSAVYSTPESAHNTITPAPGAPAGR